MGRIQNNHKTESRHELEDLIRCGECKWCVLRDVLVCVNKNAPWNKSQYDTTFVFEGDYCSYAERKD